MHIYDKFEYLCELKKVSKPDAYKAMGINKATISLWSSARDNGEPIVPSSKNAMKMSEYFGYPLEYFLMGNEIDPPQQKENPTPTNGDGLEITMEDIAFLETFRAADADTQAAIRLLLARFQD